MLRIFSILLLVLAVNCSYHGQKRIKRQNYYLGENDPIKNTPYLARLAVNEPWAGSGMHHFDFCAGAIISELWILTTASCLKEYREHASSIDYKPSLVIGTSDYHSPNTDEGDRFQHGFGQSIIHEDYDENIVDNDIALLKVYRPLKFNDRQNFIKIRSTPVINETAKVIGMVQNEEYNMELETLVATVFNSEKCTKKYMSLKTKKKLSDNMLCIEAENYSQNKGNPVVDSNGYLVGLLHSSNKKTPSVGLVTNVFKYRKWIENHTNIELIP